MTQARHAKQKKKLDRQDIGKIAEKLLAKFTRLKRHLIPVDRAKHRKKVDKEKAEKVAEKIIIKTGLMFALVFIPLAIIFFVFFEFGGWLKDAIEFIGAIIQKIIDIIQTIIVTVQKVISVFKQFTK